LNVAFKESFLRDIERIRSRSLRERVKGVIERVEAAQTSQGIPNLRRLRGGERHYRIRVGHYRLGVVIEGDSVVFVRFLHRRELYRFFP